MSTTSSGAQGGPNIEAILPLTPLQQGILYHTLESKKEGVYFGQFSCSIDGPLNANLFEQAWDIIFSRHSVLRTLFSWERRPQPLQIVRERVETPLEFDDWRDVDAENQDRLWDALTRTQRSKGFDLATAPLLRLNIVCKGPDQYRFLLSFHHIILDGWSTRMLFDEALRHYADLAPGVTPHPDPAPSFGAFVNAQKVADTTKGLEFFRDMLEGFSIPTCPEIRSSSGDEAKGSGTASVLLEASLTARLAGSAKQSRLTLNTLVVGAWASLLHRYCDTDDAVFGATLAGRSPEWPEAEITAGLFINTLPLRVRRRDDESLLTWLRAIQALQTEVQAHQQTPLIEVIRETGIQRGSALFESIVVFENFPPQNDAERCPLIVSSPQYREFSHYPLAILVVPGERLELIAIYDRERYSKAASEQLLEHLGNLLIGMTAALESGADTVSMLSERQRERLLRDYNDTNVSFPNPQPVHRHIQEVAERKPDAIAVVDDTGELSYAELDRNANRLAHFMRQRGARKGTVVALLMGRSSAAIVAMLAVLKSGAAYAPLDSRLPSVRIISMLVELKRSNDANSLQTLIISDRALPPGLDTQIASIRIDEEQQLLATFPKTEPEGETTGDDPAYVIFTSGSTGEPKGVLVSHSNLLNSTLARPHFYKSELGAFLMMSSLATDSSVAGVYWSLFSGAKLVLSADRVEQDVAKLAQLISAHRVSHLLAVPSLYGVLLEHFDTAEFETLDTVIVAGEACSGQLVENHHQLLPGVRIYNEYGPTEGTVWATCTELRPKETVTIGRPVANNSVYVLDSCKSLVPEGVPGELYIGGAGVAIGYLNDQQKTAEKFVASPFSTVPGARLYRTGDRAVWCSNGELEFIGRVDNQIKVRGFRVEPEEIEAVISSQMGVDAAAVFLDNNGRLTACVEAKKLDVDVLRNALKSDLPNYMLPQQFVEVDTLPRTPTGKIDRHALRKSEWQSEVPQHGAEFVAPRNSEERRLAEAWSKVLGMDEVSVFDDFFEVGGDSLLSIRILAQLGSVGLRVRPEDFFAHPTIAGQASVAISLANHDAVPEAEDGEVALSPVQHWFVDRVRAHREQWNLCRVYRLGLNCELQDIQRISAALVHHHDALRLRFESVSNGLRQMLGDADAEAMASEVNLSTCTGDELQHRIDEVATRINRSITLEKAPLLRLVLVRAPDGLVDRLVLCAHHLIVDALSLGFLEEDLRTGLNATNRDKPINFPPRTTSVADWNRRLATSAADLLSSADLDFWGQAIGGAVSSVPRDMAGGINDEASATAIISDLDEDVTNKLLHEVPNAYRVKVAEVLLAALAITLNQWAGAKTVTVDIEGHGREPVLDGLDNSRTIGWFTSVYPVNLTCPKSDNPDDVLVNTKEALRGLPLKGMSYGIARELLDGTATEQFRRVESASVCFNFLGQTAKYTDNETLLVLEGEHCGECRNPNSKRAYLIEINAVVVGARLKVEWRYSRHLHRPETISRLAADYANAIEQLVGHCLAGDNDGASPSDFPLADLDRQGLAEIADLLGDSGDD